MSVLKENGNKPVYSIEKKEGTPFMKVKSENGWFLVMGNQKVTPDFEEEEELEIWLKNNMYDVVFSMIVKVVSTMSEAAKKVGDEDFLNFKK